MTNINRSRWVLNRAARPCIKRDKLYRWIGTVGKIGGASGPMPYYERSLWWQTNFSSLAPVKV